MFYIVMIYSVSQNKLVPVIVEKETQFVDDISEELLTRYSVYTPSEQNRYVGYMDLLDTKNGIKVLFVKNEQPKLYKHFADVADQIKVEHCIKRKIDNPYISSVAAIDTYIVHFKRGLRFLNEDINIYLENIVNGLKKGQKIEIKPLGYQKMYMPEGMINKIKDKIKTNPLLKSIHY